MRRKSKWAQEVVSELSEAERSVMAVGPSVVALQLLRHRSDGDSQSVAWGAADNEQECLGRAELGLPFFACGPAVRGFVEASS